MFECGLVSVSFRSLSVDDIFSLLSAARLPLVEWGSDVHAPRDDKAKLEYVAARQKETGIKCSSYGTYFKLGVDPTEQLSEYIAAAKTLGTRVLRIWCGDKGYGSMTDAERDKMRSEAKKAAKTAEQADVVLCLECHGGTYTDCIEGALDIMQSADSRHFRMYWQPDQWKSVTENLDYAEKIAHYTENIHVFDWEGKARFPLSHGMQVWEKYLSCFGGGQCLLLEFMPDNDPRSLAREAQTLREMIEKATRKN